MWKTFGNILTDDVCIASIYNLIYTGVEEQLPVDNCAW
jgi:hypothetical protein